MTKISKFVSDQETSSSNLLPKVMKFDECWLGIDGYCKPILYIGQKEDE